MLVKNLVVTWIINSNNNNLRKNIKKTKIKTAENHTLP